ncbi:MAG: superoxide dismutase [Patescibacteria group bacterium]
MKFELPKLPYSYDALEPFIDAKTMEIHHSKHHNTYVTKLNEALEKFPELQNKTIEELLMDLDSVPEIIRTAVRNHGGGHYNHSLFWQVMAPFGSARGKPAPEILALKEEFNKVAAGIFGSGWVWIIKDATDNLSIMTTPNQDTPLASGKKPVLGLDVWEHAYYLKYQNRRPEYIEAWWGVVNWDFVRGLLNR